MSNNSEGASTSSASSSRGHVHFTMTVKVDIGGHTSATATASASGAAAIHSSSSSSSSGPSSSTSTICAAAAAAATATAASTQDLLLKLQPLLPHLCLPPPASQQQQQQQQQQHEHHQHQQEDRRSEHHESGLELSLGLSCFNQPSGASTSPALDVEQELLQCEEPVSVPATLDKGAVGFELANANVGDGGRGGAAGAAGGGQQQQQQPLPSGLVRSDSLPVNWRVLEEQRLKREVQCQKRQEARKKRRILIDEQKQQRRKNSGTPKKVVVKDEVVEQHDDVQPSTCPDRKSSGRGSRSGRSHSHPGYSKRSKKSSTASGSVKVEAQEEDTTATATATPTTCTTVGTSTSFSSVIRPSPVHEHKNEWFDKLLEMRKSIDPKPDDNEEQTREEMSNSQQCSTSVSSSSSIARAVASGSLACPVTSSTLTTISAIEPQTPHRVVTSSFRGDKGDHVPRLPPPPPPPPLTPPPSLLRSVSLGTFRDQQEQQQQRSSIGSTSTSTSTLRAPSPVRCSNSSLMRTLSEGAAMRSSLSLSADSWNKRSSKISAFKSPRKEQLQQVNGAIGWGGRASSTVSEAATGSSSGAASDLPWVTTTGTGPNGKTVTGVLFAYKKGEVKIVCACHGQHMTAKQFVEHAGGVDVTNPEKCIVVSPVKRNMAVAPAPTSTI